MTLNNQNISPSFSEKFQKISQKKQEKPESFSESIIRKDLQQAARIGETLLGFPGNLKKAFMQTRDVLMPGLKEYEEQLAKPEKGSLEDIIMNPPTSHEIRKKLTEPLSEKFTGKNEYLEPKNEYEKFIGETTQDLASFFLPGSNRLRLITRLGAPIVGNLAKQGLKYFDVKEETADKAKIGIMLATTIAGQSRPGEYANELIGRGKQMIPQNSTINVGNLASRLLPLYNRMQRGLNVPSKTRTMQGIRDLANQVQNNRMNFHSLMDARDNINEWIGEAGGWDIPQATRTPLLRNLNELKKEIIQTIEENMSNRFPTAHELYRNGYEASAVNHRSNVISNFIEKNFGRKLASHGAKILFPGLAGGSLFFPKLGIAGGTAFPLYKSGQVLYRVANSPTLARYYQDIITHSMQGNIPAMVKSMSKLDKSLKKEEEKDSKNNKLSLQEFKSKFKNKD